MKSIYGLEIIANIALNKAISKIAGKDIDYYIKRTLHNPRLMKKLDINFLIKYTDKDINKEPPLSFCRVFVSFHRVVIKLLKKFGLHSVGAYRNCRFL